MKKILAIILTVAMAATMLALSVSAADTKVTPVGENTGVTSFDPTQTGGQDLNIKVTDVTHKYAVDVTFNISVLTIGGNITWDVNNMEYVVNGETLTKTEQTIDVSNRSDLPVYAFATVTKTNTDDHLTVTADKNSATNNLTVNKATPKASGADKGTATTEKITITIDKASDSTWNNVAEYYAAKRLASENQATDTFKIATITVTISKD